MLIANKRQTIRLGNHKIQCSIFVQDIHTSTNVAPTYNILLPKLQQSRVPPQARRFDYVFTTMPLVMFLLLRDKSSKKTFKSRNGIQLYYMRFIKHKYATNFLRQWSFSVNVTCWPSTKSRTSVIKYYNILLYDLC